VLKTQICVTRPQCVKTCRPNHPKIKSQQWDATRWLRNTALGYRTMRWLSLSLSSTRMFWRSAQLACTRYQRPVTWRQACYAATSVPCHNMARLQLVDASTYSTRRNREQAVGTYRHDSLEHSWQFYSRPGSCYDLEQQVKVKLNLKQATKAQRGSRGIALLLL